MKMTQYLNPFTKLFDTTQVSFCKDIWAKYQIMQDVCQVFCGKCMKKIYTSYNFIIPLTKAELLGG